MKKIALKTYGKIIAFFLGAIAYLTGCEIFEPGIAEYGTPSADFVIKGKVVDQSSKKPIKDIRIIHKTGYTPSNDTVKTNVNGEFELKFNEFPGVDHWIYAEDLDGAQNGGLFRPDSLTVNSAQMKRIKKGSGSWNRGVFEKTDANFTLKKAEEKE